MLRRLVRGGGWLLAGKLATVFLGFGFQIVLARVLSPDEFSQYVILSSVVLLAIVLGQFGLGQTIVRGIASSLAKSDLSGARCEARNGLLVVGLVAFLIGILWVSIGPALLDGAWQFSLAGLVLLSVGAWIVFGAMQSIAAEAFRGFHDLRGTAAFASGSYGLSLFSLFVLFPLALWWWNSGEVALGSVLGAVALSVALGCVFATTLLWFRYLKGERRDLSRLPGMVSASVPLLGIQALMYVVGQAGVWVLGAVAVATEVGLLGAAQRLVILVPALLLMINGAVQPLVAELFARGEIPRLEALLRLAATVAGIPGMVILAVFLAWAFDLMELMFGEAYRPGGWAVVWLSGAQLVNVWVGSCAVALVMTGKQNILFWIVFASAAIILLLLLLLAPLYGASGAAAAIACGVVLQNIAGLIAVRRALGIWTHMTNPLRLVHLTRLVRG